MFREHKIAHSVAAFVSVALFAPLAWMVFDRAPPFVITGGEIEPATAVAGSVVQVTWHIKIMRTCQPSGATVTRTFIDKDKIAYTALPAPSRYKSDQADPTRIVNQVVVPTVLPPGPTRYKSRPCYPCNPIQEWWPICFDTPELMLEVVPQPQSGQARH